MRIQGSRSGWFLAMNWLCALSGYTALFVANLVCVSLVTALAMLDSRGTLGWPLCRLWGKIIHWGAWSPVRTTGFEALAWNQPCILMINHQSHMDVPAIVSMCPTPIRFVARKAAFSVLLLVESCGPLVKFPPIAPTETKRSQGCKRQPKKLRKGEPYWFFQKAPGHTVEAYSP